jgi:hypothetical protein
MHFNWRGKLMQYVKQRRAFLASTATTAIACFALSLALPSAVLAQAGSTGGTVGKTEKSLSGGEDADRPQASRSGVRHTRSVGAVSICSKVVGVWQGALGGNITYKSGGTVSGTAPVNEGTWSCNNAQITVTWIKLAAVDQCTLSSDGVRQTCTNNLGYAFVRTRKTETNQP